jgi:hypothetical protein
MKKKLQWRKWFRVVHRDFGYLFFGITLIYSISGIALNHLDDWNSNYIVTQEVLHLENPELITNAITKDEVRDLMEEYDLEGVFKNFYFPQSGYMKVFLKGGSVVFNLETGDGILELVQRRPFFREMNYLHYNPVLIWTWISDIFAGALIILAITGLFLVKGPKGITKRGAWLTILGILIPLIILWMFFY